MVELSLLFENADDERRASPCSMPDYCMDLNLDQVVDAACAGRADYELQAVFYRPLRNIDEVAYRHEVFQDIERLNLSGSLHAFSEKIRGVRSSLSSLDKIYSLYHRKGWFLEEALEYIDAVRNLFQVFSCADLGSRALTKFKAYLLSYIDSDLFRQISMEANGLKRDLSTIHYTARIKYLTVKVSIYDGEIDYGVDIEETFKRFSQSTAKSYLVKFPDSAGVDHVQAQILGCVAKLYPEIFDRLLRFCDERANFMDMTIDAFEREVNFYLAWIDHMAMLRTIGLQFSLPKVSQTDKAIEAEEVFDIALAGKAVATGTDIVTNDFASHGAERILVVTGPNQGGKTTFARTIGQLHHLASIGCPVPGIKAQLFLPDRIFTHFEREERVSTRRGKLHDEIVRIHDSLEAATSRSVFILNEVFTSTTILDSVFLSREVLKRIENLDAICVCVTFLDELASGGANIASFVCAVDHADPSIRTFKVERRPADGLAYARALAEKHGLTYEMLKARIEA